ncbi:glycosyltransferase [Vibrio parahaemolyticus]|nr:glycosyltransferase [Vibrio parahaemolyticus]EIU6845735.1 glycosyltransferase [Vibrio parahaemolyticus]EJA3302938.1 glycosyltransferase [Vibrio parahaemolyticus]EJG0665885.1 glycosyltransferase [Vibrio parahaemolyticus]ELA6809890.1 glycosyltransferase [Vibrio parahaemolyticus]
MKKLLIVNGTDYNQRASGSGVVIKQFLKNVPSDIEVTFLNIGSDCDIKGINCQSVQIQRTPSLIKKVICLFSFTSLMYSKYLRSRDVQSKIADLHRQEKFDVIYYHDTIAVQNYIELSGVKNLAHFIDLHSRSYAYYLKSEKKLIKKMAYYRENHICKLEERKLINKFSQIFLVNKNEADYANKKYHTNKFRCIPLGVDLSCPLVEISPQNKKNINLLYIGNLGYKANIDGLNHFVNEYFEKFSKNVVLNVVGPGSENYNTDKKNIVTHGYIDDFSEFMAKMDIGIATMVNGSGLKNKIFDYLKFGMPVLVNTYTLNSNNIDNPYLFNLDDYHTFEGLLSSCLEIPRVMVKDSIWPYNEIISCEEFWSKIRGVQ